MFSPKRDWPDGAWHLEPDELAWVDAKTNYACYARRGPSGAWCGYVEVPRDHLMFGADYNDLEIQVHGGLTYSDEITETESWRFGFDCAHHMDLAPAFVNTAYFDGGVYRTLEYVQEQCASLALQLEDLNVSL